MKKLKSNQVDDKLQKQLAFESVNDLLKAAGVEVNIIEHLSVENVRVLPLTRGDYKGLNKDERIIHIEFQKGKPNPVINKRIYDYNSGFHVQDMDKNRLVDSFVFFTDIERSHIVEYQTGSLNTFKYHALTLKTIDGEEQLNNIKEKIKNNEELSGVEIITLKMIIYTRYTKPIHEIMLEACKITKSIKNISSELKDEIAAYQKITCQKAIDEKYHEKIKGVIKMYDSFYKEEFEELEKLELQINELKTKVENAEKEASDAKKETKKEIIERLLNIHTIDEISQIVGLKNEEIKQMITENQFINAK